MNACRGVPLRADEIRGDHRLPVAGRERVRRAPEHRDQERERSSTPTRGRRARSAPRSRPGVRRRVGRRRSRAGLPALARARRSPLALETSSGERSRSPGYARSSSLALVAGTLERATRAVPRRDRHLAPADPARERVSSKRERRPGRGRRVDDVEPQRLQAAGAGSRAATSWSTTRSGTRRRRASARARGRAAPRSPARGRRPRAGTSGSRRGRARSGRRSVARDLDAGVPVDREVPERVRRRRGRSDEEGGEGEKRGDEAFTGVVRQGASRFAESEAVGGRPEGRPRATYRPLPESTCPSCCRTRSADPRCTGTIRGGSGRRR